MKKIKVYTYRATSTQGTIKSDLEGVKHSFEYPALVSALQVARAGNMKLCRAAGIQTVTASTTESENASSAGNPHH